MGRFSDYRLSEKFALFFSAPRGELSASAFHMMCADTINELINFVCKKGALRVYGIGRDQNSCKHVESGKPKLH